MSCIKLAVSVIGIIIFMFIFADTGWAQTDRISNSLEEFIEDDATSSESKFSENEVNFPDDVTLPFGWYRYQGALGDTNCPNGNANCGPTVVAMAIQFAKAQWVSIADVRRFIGGACSANTTINDLERALQNWDVSFTKIAGIDAVVSAVEDEQKIVIVPVSMSELPQGADFESPNSEPFFNKDLYKNPGNHWLIVKGVSTDKKWIITYDPNVFGSGTGVYWYSNKNPKGQDRYYDFNKFSTAFANLGNQALVINEQPLHNVSGTVYDELGNPVNNATVLLTDGKARVAPIRTGLDGGYTFTTLFSDNAFVVAIKGNTIASARVTPHNSQSLILGSPTTQRIFLPTDGTIKATFIGTGAPGDQTGCTGNFELSSPISHSIFRDYLTYAGLSTVIDDFRENDELVFSLKPGSFCAGNTYFSTDEKRTVISQPEPTTWLVGWEDWADNDFNDLVVRIDLEPKQQPFLTPLMQNNIMAAGPNDSSLAFTNQQFLSSVDALMDHDPTDNVVIFSGYSSMEPGPVSLDEISYNGNAGTDFNFNLESDIFPAASGSVTYAGEQSFNCPLTGQQLPANVVKLYHSNGYTSEYWWLDSISNDIKSEQQVTVGTSLLGQSGFNSCTGKEGLHFIVRNPAGNAVDPFGWHPRLDSFSAGLSDPWQEYYSVLDSDATSYTLWNMETEASKLVDPLQGGTISSASNMVTVTLPTGIAQVPFRLEVTHEGARLNVNGASSKHSFSLSGYTAGEFLLMQSEKPMRLDVFMPNEAAIDNLHLFYWEPETSSWQQLATSWQSNENTLTAFSSRFGTFAVAERQTKTYLPLVSN